mgnify:CR=1 FL=1
MKKMFALIMALVMCLLCASAMAQETQTYTHPVQGYSIQVPADWLCVDKTNVQQYIDAYEKGEMSFTGTNAMTLEELKPQLETADCAVLINPYANNVVIVKENMVNLLRVVVILNVNIFIKKKKLGRTILK